MKDLEYPCEDSDDAVDCHEHHCSIENDLATYNNKSNNYNEDGYCWHHLSDELYCELKRCSNYIFSKVKFSSAPEIRAFGFKKEKNNLCSYIIKL